MTTTFYEQQTPQRSDSVSLKSVLHFQRPAPPLLRYAERHTFATETQLKVVPKDEIPRLRATFPALGNILPDVQINDVAKQAFDGDRDGKEGIQGESM